MAKITAHTTPFGSSKFFACQKSECGICSRSAPVELDSKRAVIVCNCKKKSAVLTAMTRNMPIPTSHLLLGPSSPESSDDCGLSSAAAAATISFCDCCVPWTTHDSSTTRSLGVEVCGKIKGDCGLSVELELSNGTNVSATTRCTAARGCLSPALRRHESAKLRAASSPNRGELEREGFCMSLRAMQGAVTLTFFRQGEPPKAVAHAPHALVAIAARRYPVHALHTPSQAPCNTPRAGTVWLQTEMRCHICVQEAMHCLNRQEDTLLTIALQRNSTQQRGAPGVCP